MREERWCRQARIRCLACVRHLRQDMAMLLCERGHSRHHDCDKTAASFPLRPTAAFAPPHPGAAGPLRRIVRGLHACHAPKGPPAVVDCEPCTTDACCLGHATRLARCEPPRDLASQRTPQDTAARVGARAITDTRPPGKHLAGLRSQGFANLLGAPPAFDQGCKVPPQRRPAAVPPPGDTRCRHASGR